MLDLKIEPMAFGIYNCPPSWIVNEKGTVFHRLYFVYQGEATYSDAHTSFLLEEAHIYLFPVNKAYNITHNPGNPFLCMYFHISTLPLILNSVIDINTLSCPSVFHMVKTLEYILKHITKYQNNESMLSQILNALVNLFDSEIKLELSDQNKLQNVLNFIHEHYSEKLTNVCLANIAGFDHYYFARLFRKTFGVSPQEYISNYRLIKAQNLIRSRVPIKQVAEIVGFQDQKAFSRSFKNAIGCPPSHYLKSHSMQP